MECARAAGTKADSREEKKYPNLERSGKRRGSLDDIRRSFIRHFDVTSRVHLHCARDT